MRSFSLAVFLSAMLVLFVQPTIVEAQIAPVSQSRFVQACTTGGCSNFTAVAFEDVNVMVAVTTNFAGFSGGSSASQTSQIRSSSIQGGGSSSAGGNFAVNANSSTFCSVTFQVSSNVIYTLSVTLFMNEGFMNFTGPPGVMFTGPNGTILSTNSSGASFTQVGLLSPGQYTISGGASASGGGTGGNTSFSFNLGVTPAPAITAITPTNDDILLTWVASTGATNVVQATSGGADGSYSNNFSDLSPTIIVGSSGATNYLDVGGATNFPARYYRIRTPVN